MHILRLRATNFMSWGDLDLDLTDLDFVAIVGKVGAGKTSLIDVITWGLYGQAYHEDVINENADGCSVTVDFIGKNEHVRVTRVKNRNNRGNDLSVVIVGGEAERDENDKRHIKKETQAVIEDYIGLGWGALSAGPLMMQGKEEGFLALGPSDRKDLLIKVFGVEIYEQYFKEANALVVDYRMRAEALQRDLHEAEAEVEREPEVTAQLNTAVMDLLRETTELTDLQSQMTSARERQIAMREQQMHAETLRQTVEMLATRIKQDQEAHSRALEDLSKAHQMTDEPEPTFEPIEGVSDEQLAKAKALAERFEKGGQERMVLEATMPAKVLAVEQMRRAAEIKNDVPCGGEGIYATCRFLVNAPSDEAITEAQAEYAQMQERYAVLPPPEKVALVRRNYEVLVSKQTAAERAKLQQETVLTTWRMKVDNAKSMVVNGKDNLTRLETQMQRDAGLLDRARTQLRGVAFDPLEIEALEVQVTSLKEQADEKEKTIELVYKPAQRRAEEASEAVKKAKQRRIVLDKEYRETMAKVALYEGLARAFHRDGIPTSIIENGVPLIEERANEVLSRMPDGLQVRIRTQKSRKDGSGSMERVNVIVERKGRERSYGNLSGGQRFQVNFAIRVAIGRALAHRAGTTIDTLILDEGFATQDDEGVQALLQSLASVQDEFKLILVVSHTQAVKDAAPRRLEVVLGDDDLSSYRLAA